MKVLVIGASGEHSTPANIDFRVVHVCFRPITCTMLILTQHHRDTSSNHRMTTKPGRIGSRALISCLEQGHSVTAFLRTPSKIRNLDSLTQQYGDRLRIFKGDATSKDDLIEAMKGALFAFDFDSHLFQHRDRRYRSRSHNSSSRIRLELPLRYLRFRNRHSHNRLSRPHHPIPIRPIGLGAPSPPHLDPLRPSPPQPPIQSL